MAINLRAPLITNATFVEEQERSDRAKEVSYERVR